MDNITHTIHGGLMIAITSIIMDLLLMNITFTSIIPLIILFMILGGFIDWYGEYKAHIKKDNYIWYNRAHIGDLSKIFLWMPPMGLHIWLDILGHGLGKRWYAGIWWEYFIPTRYKERMWMVPLIWSINIILILITIFYYTNK